MCKSKAQGGQRCFGHANKRFDKAMGAVAKALRAASRDGATDKDAATLREAQVARDEAAIHLASTAQGQDRIRALADAAREAGQDGAAGMYESFARQGQALRDQNAAVARAMAAHGSRNPFTRGAEADEARRQSEEYQRIQAMPSQDDDDDVSDSAYARHDLSGRLDEWADNGGFTLPAEEQKASFARFVGEEASARFDSYLSDDEQEDTWNDAQRRANANPAWDEDDEDEEETPIPATGAVLYRLTDAAARRNRGPAAPASTPAAPRRRRTEVESGDWMDDFPEEEDD